jgi:hypothetical protein
VWTQIIKRAQANKYQSGIAKLTRYVHTPKIYAGTGEPDDGAIGDIGDMRKYQDI